MSAKQRELPVEGLVIGIRTFFGRHYGILIGLVLLCAAISLYSPKFLSVGNFVNILRQISVSGIVAISLALVLLTGGIDLSVGSTCAASGCLFAVFYTGGASVWVAISLALLVALLIGLLNGGLVAYTTIPPFIITLSTQMIVRGVAYWFTQGYPVVATGNDFGMIGSGSWKWRNDLGRVAFELPYSIVLMLIVYLIFWLLLSRSRFGRHVYAIGGNVVAAEHSGINVRSVLIICYAMSGVLAGLAGIILASRVYSGQPTSGTGYETAAIAAAVVGGVSFSGGIGTIGGTFIGSLIMGVIANGMNLLKLDYYFQYIAQGSVVIAAVLVDSYFKQNRGSGSFFGLLRRKKSDSA